MGVPGDRKIGLRTALLAIVLGGILLCAAVLHLTWWRTATKVSHDLVDVLETQVTEAVRREWWNGVLKVEGLVRTVRDLLDAEGGSIPVDTILTAATRPSNALSWVVLAPADGDVTVVESMGSDRLRVLDAAADGTPRLVKEIGSKAGQQPAMPLPDRLVVRGEPWLEDADASSEPRWEDVPTTPDGSEEAVAFVVPTDRGVLAAMIGYDRFASLLGSIKAGKTGRAYVVGPTGEIVIASKSADRALTDLDAVALAAAKRVAARPADGLNIEEKVRLEVGGAGYAVGLSPLWFRGWQLAIIVPEAEYLEPIDATIRRLAMMLAIFLPLAGGAVAIGARRFIADPVARVAQDLHHVERFELEKIPRRHSTLSEIDRLSDAITRMAASLADFGKFIPTELVRGLLASGVRAEPGGERREVTLLFADLAGFTSLSEKLGDRVVPVVSSFLELASQAIEQEGGTIDKFIGDAIMAFWGAPNADEDQAVHACRAALRIAEAMRAAPEGSHLASLRVRLGLASGPAIIGNVGSARRLNYTALGDTVNLASRLEAVNKIYGTTILMAESTRVRAGGAIMAREIDRVAVYGKAEGVLVFELLGLAGTVPTPAVQAYEDALALYRRRDFGGAVDRLGEVAELDGPARWLVERCRRLASSPADPAWQPVTQLDMK
ncbi:MAG: adenylate/guanylate cyclase domain-containing protein [Geminicoccaceae bacterium]